MYTIRPRSNSISGMIDVMKLAHVHSHKSQEPVWHVQLAVVAAIALQLVVPLKLSLGPKFVIALFELLLLLALALIRRGESRAAHHLRHTMAITLIALISFANIVSLILVIHSLFGGSLATGLDLITAGVAIYLTNIIMFGMWYWELDSSGISESQVVDAKADFLFPQFSVNRETPWQPTFFDYLYVSVTNAAAFSPTDTLPLTHRAKFLMTLQSLVSLLTVALVTARAVNILT